METSGSAGAQARPFQIGEYRIDPQRNRVSGPNATSTLEPRVMDVLRVLAERPGDVISRAELIERLWGVEYGGDESLTRAISHLRKVFGDTRDQARVIETIPKRGYRLIAPVTEAESEAAASRQRRRTTWLLGGGALAAALLAIVLFWLVASPGSAPHSPAPRTGIILEVRPFSNDGASSAGGFSETLENAIARNPLIRVRTASAAASADLPDTMPYALQGAIRREGPHASADVQLLDSATGEVVWSEHYERANDAGEALAAAISSEVQFPLLRAAKSKLEQRPVEGLTPWQLTLLVSWIPGAEAQRWEGPPTENSYWVQQRALEIDPDYAPAHALFAELAAYHAMFHPPFDNERARARARAHAERALQLAPYDAEVVYQLGLYHRFSGDRDSAAAMFERVLELHPRHPQARVELAFTRGQCSAGSEAAIRELDMLQAEMSRANPVRWVALAHQAEMLLARGDFARAEETAQRSRQITPMTWTALTLAAAQARLGDGAAAAATLAPHRREWPALDLVYFADHIAERWCLGGEQTPQAQASFRHLAAAVAAAD